jgi:hypothetical protein
MMLRARLICALTTLGACSDPPGPETDPPALARSVALVSPSIEPPAASVVGGLAYVSMVPGTNADGQRVDIRNLRSGASTTAPMRSGGFDPLAVGAETGDTLSITVVHQAGGDTTTYAIVPIFARPTIVRTSPGMGKTDVPLNSLILVVFSQPMDSASLPDALHLRHEGVDVPGSVIGELKEGVILSGRFVPDSPLAPLSTYELSVSTGAQSQGGVPLDTPLTVEFTTVTAPPGAPAAFPPVPAGALTYVRVSAEMSGAESRYVLYEDSTFGLQYLSARWGFFEYTGRYARVNASISLDFDANRPQWQATASIQGDSLVVTYNTDMMLSDFEDGVYRLASMPKGVWTSLTPMPEARSGTGSAALDGIVYVAGGIAVAGDGWVTRPGILAYDPATNEWRTAGTLTRPVAVPGVVSLGNRLYVVGGRDENLSDSDDLQILDPATSQVEMGPAMPTPRGGLAVTVLDSRLHAIGGESLESDEASFSHEVFDPATGAWSSRARAPIGGNGIAAATIDGRIYIVGHGNSRLYVYSPATDTWTTHAAPLDQANSAAVALGGKFYVLGGGEFGTAATGWIPSDQVDRFDPETGVWDRAAPIPSPRSSPSVAVVGDAIYLISGWTGTGLSFNYSALNEHYTLE